jgi:hypothetical protein
MRLPRTFGEKRQISWVCDVPFMAPTVDFQPTGSGLFRNVLQIFMAAASVATAVDERSQHFHSTRARRPTSPAWPSMAATAA